MTTVPDILSGNTAHVVISNAAYNNNRLWQITPVNYYKAALL